MFCLTGNEEEKKKEGKSRKYLDGEKRVK